MCTSAHALPLARVTAMGYKYTGSIAKRANKAKKKKEWVKYLNRKQKQRPSWWYKNTLYNKGKTRHLYQSMKVVAKGQPFHSKYAKQLGASKKFVPKKPLVVSSPKAIMGVLPDKDGYYSFSNNISQKERAKAAKANWLRLRRELDEIKSFVQKNYK